MNCVNTLINHKLTVQFLGSFTSELPRLSCPIVAFWGRSNVGKSSLLNALFNSKLAKTSHNPGRTQTLNYFLESTNNKPLKALVDMPGYGYAKTSKSNRATWLNNSFNFLQSQYPKVLMLIDAEVGLKESDLDAIATLQDFKLNPDFVLTKTDKANLTQLLNTQETLKALMVTYHFTSTMLLTSVKKNTGVLQVRQFLRELTQ